LATSMPAGDGQAFDFIMAGLTRATVDPNIGA
jgi:hypothetical protein